jgi:AcrR family transcriptional regulator
MTDVTNAYGHRIGSRGITTRSSLLDALRGLLNLYPAHNLQVKNVTDIVGCSPAVFWTYFAHLDDAYRALADTVGDGDAQTLWARQVKHIVKVLDEVAETS